MVVHYKLILKDVDKVHEFSESWKTRYNIDELAFTNCDFENKSIKIIKVSRAYMAWISSSSGWFSSEPGFLTGNSFPLIHVCMQL
jgi:hypothetical protein